MPLTLFLNHNPVAIGYSPALPPPRGILADWKRQSGSSLTTVQLDAALRTGKPVELGPGAWLEWGTEE